VGGTLPGKKSRERLRRSRDSGSSGADRDRSSGSRKSDSRHSKTSGNMVRKPSKELLKIQNFSDTSTEDLNNLLPVAKHPRAKRRGSKHNSGAEEGAVTANSTDELQVMLSLPPDDCVSSNTASMDKEQEEDSPKMGLAKNRQRASKSGRGESHYRSSSRPSTSSSGGVGSRNRSSGVSPEKKTAAWQQQQHSLEGAAAAVGETGSVSLQQQQRKSLNRQIKEFTRSPPKARKLSGSCANFATNFDAFNHTSSLKLSGHHSMHSASSFKETSGGAMSLNLVDVERRVFEEDVVVDVVPASGATSRSSGQFQFEEYYDYIHPRRSSKEVLDFTSSRKSQKDLTKLEEDRGDEPEQERHRLSDQRFVQESPEPCFKYWFFMKMFPQVLICKSALPFF
jgi:hypothetical protein